MEKKYSGGVYCSICDRCLSRPRKRLHFLAESFIECDICCEKSPLKAMFKRVELYLTEREKMKLHEIKQNIHSMHKKIKQSERVSFELEWLAEYIGEFE